MANANVSSSASSGIGFGGLLTIVFITLKLLGKITWPWIWVICPLWIPFAIILIVGFCMIIFYSIISQYRRHQRKKEEKLAKEAGMSVWLWRIEQKKKKK